jgi:hypothetical protein
LFIDCEGVIVRIYQGPLVGSESRNAIMSSELEKPIEEILGEGPWQ